MCNYTFGDKADIPPPKIPTREKFFYELQPQANRKKDAYRNIVQCLSTDR